MDDAIEVKVKDYNERQTDSRDDTLKYPGNEETYRKPTTLGTVDTEAPNVLLPVNMRLVKEDPISTENESETRRREIEPKNREKPERIEPLVMKETSSLDRPLATSNDPERYEQMKRLSTDAMQFSVALSSSQTRGESEIQNLDAAGAGALAGQPCGAIIWLDHFAWAARLHQFDARVGRHHRRALAADVQ